MVAVRMLLPVRLGALLIVRGSTRGCRVLTSPLLLDLLTAGCVTLRVVRQGA